MAEDIKLKILQFLKENSTKQYSVKDISEMIGISYPSVLKWVEVLKAENEIIVEDYGNVKIIRCKND